MPRRCLPYFFLKHVHLMPVGHVAQAQDRENWPRTANGSSSWSATCYLIAVKTGKIRCETLLKSAQLAIIPLRVLVPSRLAILAILCVYH
jgi:hypothetical protein